ncbi:hypothetical protein J3E73DRAFT_260405 [Bipolaris maydis]|nr:hypothetical protein J3E73DRAFT_260405 [Bipolaris maydis]
MADRCKAGIAASARGKKRVLQCGASSSSHVCTGRHGQGGMGWMSSGSIVPSRTGQHNVAPSWARDRAEQDSTQHTQPAGQVEYGSGRSNDGSIQARRHGHGMAGSSPQFTAPLCMPWHASSASRALTAHSGGA